MSRRIVIVGGGYIGIELAKSLDDKADVTLIEPNDRFVHAAAMIRAMVQPQLLDQALIPYDRLMTRGRVVQARAESIDATGVTLEGGERIGADYIVVATGSNNAAPFKTNDGSIAQLRANSARIHGMLSAAGSIAIVGAGAVGTELAGEIAHFMPEKTVTLVSSDAALFPGMPKKMGRSLEAKLRAAGVKVILGAKATNLQSLTEPYAGSLTLSDGSEIAADLIFPAIGSRPSSRLLEALPGAVKTSAHRIRTDAWMRPSALPNVFAAGDVADAGDAMTIVAVTRQVPWLKKTLLSLVEGKKLESLKPYKPWAKGKAPLLVPLGPQKGSSFLMVFTAGDLLTRAIKGKELFIPKYRKAMGRA